MGKNALKADAIERKESDGTTSEFTQERKSVPIPYIERQPGRNRQMLLPHPNNSSKSLTIAIEGIDEEEGKAPNQPRKRKKSLMREE